MSLLEVPPSVYAVKGQYQICVLVTAECTMHVKVGEQNFFDHSNGILRSGKFLHIAKIPQPLLDEARSYTVILRRIIERKPYFTTCGDEERQTFTFRPVEKKDEYKIINLADTHSLIDAPISSGSYFGENLDLLILNGDIPEHADNIDAFRAIYKISGAISRGTIPSLFARGNHDMRGRCAEQLEDYTPTDNGKSYYTFRLGPIWGIVLDTGEDKRDESAEYGNTICCSAFRDEEELFIDDVIARREYSDAQVRLIVCHKPINHRIKPPFDIEDERFRRWCRKLAQISPTLMLSGHLHEAYCEPPGGSHDTYHLACPVICSSRVNKEEGTHLCGAVTIKADGRFNVIFNESK